MLHFTKEATFIVRTIITNVTSVACTLFTEALLSMAFYKALDIAIRAIYHQNIPLLQYHI